LDFWPSIEISHKIAYLDGFVAHFINMAQNCLIFWSFEKTANLQILDTFLQRYRGAIKYGPKRLILINLDPVFWLEFLFFF
jgi:hypothetical protein